MRVTVTIPSYNHAQFVTRAIESVKAQTWKDLELIVIDDGSSDGSQDLIRDLHARIGGFQCVLRENRGLVATLAEALEMATGEFFCELASDDFFPEDSVEKRILPLAKDRSAVAIFADGRVVDEMGRVVADTIVQGRRRTLFHESDPLAALIDGSFPVFSTCLFKREAFVRMGGFDANTFRYYEDLESPILLALAGKVLFSPEHVIFRRIHGTNVSTTTPHVRVEKVLLYRKLLGRKELSAYHGKIVKRLRREFFLFLRAFCSAPQEFDTRAAQLITQDWAWRYISGPRSLYYLIRARMLRGVAGSCPQHRTS